MGRDGAAKVITRFPQVLGLSVEDNLAPKVMFLVEDAGAGREGAADIILTQPSLLSMSIERNLRPKLHFLLDKFPGTSGAQAMKLALHSLAGKLMPRMRLLESHGMAGLFSASTIAGYSTAKFRERVGVTEEEYDAEVEVCKREHEQLYPRPAGAAAAGEGRGLVARAERSDRSTTETMDDAIASNKAGSAKRYAKRRAKLTAAKSSV